VLQLNAEYAPAEKDKTATLGWLFLLEELGQVLVVFLDQYTSWDRPDVITPNVA